VHIGGIVMLFLSSFIDTHIFFLFLQFMHLCPPGSEGVTFAVLSTMASIGGAVSYDLGTALATLFDVSNESLTAGDFSGMLYLTILTRWWSYLIICWLLIDLFSV
jgi:hypothetical protein